MNARMILLQTLIPLLTQMSRSPDQALAAEAADELASRTKEMAKLKREAAKPLPSPSPEHPLPHAA